MVPLIIFSLFLAFIALYTFFGLRSALFSVHPKLFGLIYLGLELIVITGIITMVHAFSNFPINQSKGLNFMVGLSFSIIIAQLFTTSFFLVEDLLRAFLWLFQSAVKFRLSEFISRSYIWGMLAFVVGGFFLVMLNYGVWFGKYQYKVHKKTLYFENLPEAFNGFKIAQLSDAHLGTFDNYKKVVRGLKLLQKQNPDLIVFTGDMVNNKADEARIYVEAFKNLHAPFGKYTILGNHDYGDYSRWKSAKEKSGNLTHLHEVEKQMGFEWLDNRHVALTKDHDTLFLAGVENWGLPPFPQHGDLKRALSGLSDDDFIVLLSHDPSHWRAQVVQALPKVALTLSGHTHGMQFGFELGKWRWSPVKYKYHDWADLYENNHQYLYVNRGFGNIGYPGRLGIRPEITVIELRRK